MTALNQSAWVTQLQGRTTVGLKMCDASSWLLLQDEVVSAFAGGSIIVRSVP
jgi:hypothetical protein